MMRHALLLVGDTGIWKGQPPPLIPADLDRGYKSALAPLKASDIVRHAWLS